MYVIYKILHVNIEKQCNSRKNSFTPRLINKNALNKYTKLCYNELSNQNRE